MKKGIKFAAAAVAVASIVGTGSYAAWHFSDVERAKRDVRERLVDPSSAIFSDVERCDEDGKLRYVAGLVNARNSMGGMTGKRLFLAQAIGGGFNVTVESGNLYDNPNLGDTFAMARRYALSHPLTCAQIEARALDHHIRGFPGAVEDMPSGDTDGGGMRLDNLTIDDLNVSDLPPMEL
ncbi:hypothetical protein [Sphingomonas carotinifaciens]|uniref:Uncharacterized protein n=2 Tax=Sphingomonas carotinifaciens TaxID=1166323 RepID=A0A6N8LXN9_9SPHN|nr:hypothetical protein [Sphingomonas carotinifaciens]MBB4085103.1 hypothetical protein [Sphingomonas carotinifaciens]MWC44481.1 hypothetical protein [Sphingomonas carotinifaciens]